MTLEFAVPVNVSYYPKFSEAMGFTDGELRKLIPQIVDADRYGFSVDEIFDRMKVLYGGYRFSPYSDASVFNPSMCLYYLREIAEHNCEPSNLLDPSFSVDLSKIDGILSLGEKSFVKSIVKDVLFDRSIKRYGASKTIDHSFFKKFTNQDVLTALFFMGFLTFSSDEPNCLVCPNRVVKDLFLKYWFWKFEHFDGIPFSLKTQEEVFAALIEGNIRPLLDFVSEVLSESVGGHAHAHLSETAIQLAAVMAMNTCSVYRVTAEEEALDAGYADLILRPAKEYADAAAWLIEFKYIKKTDANQADVDEQIGEAAAQLERYSAAQNISSIPNLRRAAAVFSGTELKGLKVF